MSDTIAKLRELLLHRSKAGMLRGLLDQEQQQSSPTWNGMLGGLAGAPSELPYKGVEMTPERIRSGLSGLVDMTPVVGDIKSGIEGVQAAREGDWAGAGLGMLGALPFVPGMGGWIKGAKPWEMMRKDYDTPAALKPQESFYEKLGSSDVEIVRNPSQADLNAMRAEAKKEFPNSTYDDPVLRHTDDIEGNRYYWKANLGVHQQIEPKIATREGVDVNQNASQKLSHRGAVRRALYEGENVPDNVIAEYPGIVQEVLAIQGNKIGMSNKYRSATK